MEPPVPNILPRIAVSNKRLGDRMEIDSLPIIMMVNCNIRVLTANPNPLTIINPPISVDLMDFL